MRKRTTIMISPKNLKKISNNEEVVLEAKDVDYIIKQCMCSRCKKQAHVLHEG